MEEKNSAFNKAEKIFTGRESEKTDGNFNNGSGSKIRDKKHKAYIMAICCLTFAVLFLSTVFTVNMVTPRASDNSLNALYNKSFYGTVEQVENIDLNLSKILASKDLQAINVYLSETAINASIAENELQQLPIADENKYYTTKLINQIGDFCKTLYKKIADGGTLTEDEYTTLYTLYRHNVTLKNALSEMSNKDGQFNYDINGNSVLSGFNELQNLSVEYPELIYDGPFSDGKDRATMKGLPQDEITSERAIEIFKDIFDDATDVKLTGESKATIECYQIEGETGVGKVYAEISKKGGKLIAFNTEGDCNAVNIDSDEAVDVAVNYCSRLGIDNMKGVWINLSDNLYTVNLAYTESGIIMYPDLIKIRVCAETGGILGFEGTTYYTNHTERVLASAGLTVSEARHNVSDNISVETERLVVIPIGESGEKLCYEFSGVFDGTTYYVYIDAMNGKQVEMFKVVKTTEGTLLM